MTGAVTFEIGTGAVVVGSIEIGVVGVGIIGVGGGVETRVDVGVDDVDLTGVGMIIGAIEVDTTEVGVEDATARFDWVEIGVEILWAELELDKIEELFIEAIDCTEAIDVEFKTARMMIMVPAQVEQVGFYWNLFRYQEIKTD